MRYIHEKKEKGKELYPDADNGDVLSPFRLVKRNKGNNIMIAQILCRLATDHLRLD
jgi:hypothetical protein